MISLYKKHYIKIFAIGIGGLMGFLYWKWIGCANGHCTIQSVWYNSTLYGAVMGYLISDLFNKNK
jgi:hypothetical protein